MNATVGCIPLSGPVPGTPVVKERPILCAGPTVRALLEGRKTAARRPVKPQPEFTGAGGDSLRWDGGPRLVRAGYGATYVHTGQEAMERAMVKVCPFGAPGDRLWVRETHCIEHQVDGVDHRPPHHDGRPVRWLGNEHEGRWWEQGHYRATDPRPELVIATADGEEPGCRWRPSIHMPRWASRITLEVTSVQAWRLQDITEDQATAEGVLPDFVPDFDAAWLPRTPARAAFANAWQRTHASDPDLSWRANPWVWAIEFRDHE